MSLTLGVIQAKDIAGDPGSLNVYTVVVVGKERYKTKLAPGTVNPLWREDYQIDTTTSKKVLVTVWSKASEATQDIFCGLATVDVATAPLDGQGHWYQLNPRRNHNDVVTGAISVSLSVPISQNAVGGSRKGERAVQDKVDEALQLSFTELDVSGLGLNSVPSALVKKTHWTSMNLGFNKYVTWPEQLNMFKNLEELNLIGNLIVSLGEDLRGLANLKRLFLNGNKLTRLDDSIAHLQALERLDAQNNEIRDISGKLGALKKLEDLNLSGNRLLTVPSEMGELSMLELLDLSGNSLKALPAQFCNMGRLLELNLGNNEIKKLPSEFGNLSRLVSINLSDNKLTDLPLTMGNCQHMDVILIDRNLIKDQELLRKYEVGSDHLKDYLSKRLFAFNQEQKRKRRENERKEAATAKLRAETKAPEPELVAATQAKNAWALEVEEEDEAELTNEEKHQKIRGHSQKLAAECKAETVTLKRALNNSTTLEQIVIIAKTIHALIPFMNAARQQMAPIPKPNPPLFRGDEDQVTKLKKVTAVAIREFETVHQQVFNIVCGNPTLEQLVSLSGVITGSLAILQNATKDMDPN